MNAVGIIALIVVIVAVIKMLVLLVNPKSWMNMAKKLVVNPVSRIIALILAGVVLNYLRIGGITIVQIFAVIAFLGLIIFVGLAPHIDSLIKKYEKQIKTGRMWKENWLYILIWLVLLIWAVKEMFF